jgi:hypothetical protein
MDAEASADQNLTMHRPLAPSLAPRLAATPADGQVRSLMADPAAKAPR